MTKFTLAVFIAICFLFCGYSTHKTDSPMETLVNIASYFKTGQLCGHNCDILISRDEYNRWNIRFTATVGDEDADELCKCMLDYINSKNWLESATHVCVKNCNYLTLVLLGPSNPKDNPVITPLSNPISTLCSTLKNFPNAEVGDYVCTSKCKQDGKLTRLKFKCKLSCELPSPKVALENVVKYLSQSTLLENTKVTAESKGQFVEVIIVGK